MDEIMKLKEKIKGLEKRLSRIEKLLEKFDLVKHLMSEEQEEELYEILRRQKQN